MNRVKLYALKRLKSYISHLVAVSISVLYSYTFYLNWVQISLLLILLLLLFFTGQWPPGSYCILASGSCPAGFTRSQGHLRALKQYSHTSAYITQATFGSSYIRCHGRCGQYGQWVGDLVIAACCKWWRKKEILPAYIAELKRGCWRAKAADMSNVNLQNWLCVVLVLF